MMNGVALLDESVTTDDRDFFRFVDDVVRLSGDDCDTWTDLAALSDAYDDGVSASDYVTGIRARRWLS